MKPTRPSALLAIGVVAGAVTYLLLQGVYGSLPRLPRLAPASLVLVAVALGLTALGTRNRLRGRPGVKPIDPLLVARYAALAKASSVVGALLAGGYAGLLSYVLSLPSAPVPRSDALTGSLGAAASLMVVGTAYALERACRVPPPPEPPDDDATPG